MALLAAESVYGIVWLLGGVALGGLLVFIIYWLYLRSTERTAEKILAEARKQASKAGMKRSDVTAAVAKLRGGK